jgi:hypothetical protein
METGSARFDAFVTLNIPHEEPSRNDQNVVDAFDPPRFGGTG